MGKCILFLRVSTKYQETDSQELVARRMACRDGYTDEDILIIKYKESAIKLKEKDREGLQDLYATLEQRNDVEAIYVTELSRLTRNVTVLYHIRDFLEEKKIQLVCGNPEFRLLNERTRKEDKMAGMVFAVFGYLAEQEMLEKRERFARGKEQKAREGKFSGGAIPFGYKVDKEKGNLIVIDEKDADVVREVFNLYESGITQPKLAKYYYERGVTRLTISFINNILNNERYTGKKHVYEGSSYERSYPPIITQVQFDRCREIAKENNTKSDKSRFVYYANRLIVCTQCGRYFVATGTKVNYHCYDAYSSIRKYEHYTSPQCKSRICISINVMDSLLWKVAQEAELSYIMNNASKDKQLYQDKMAEINVKLSAIHSRLEELNEKRIRIVDSYVEGNYTKERRDAKLQEVDELRSSTLIEQTGYQNDLRHLETLLEGINDLYGLDNVDDVANHIEKIIEIKTLIASTTDDIKRSDIIHRHIQKITVGNKDVEYEFSKGKSLTHARFVTIWFYNGDIQYYYIIPNSGLYTLIIKSNSEGDLLEKIDYEYLPRYFDESKKKYRAKERDKKINDSKELYPAEKYARGFKGLGEFLGFKGKNTLRNGFNWVRNGVLKPACLGKYRGENIFDKQMCIQLLKEVAAKKSLQASYARKILKTMGIST